MTLNSTLDHLKADASRYPDWRRHPGFWVTASYRIRRCRKEGKGILKLLLPFDILLGVLRYCISDTRLPSSIPIGPGFYLPHPNGVIINSKCSIGSNVAIFQQVTIGEWREEAPVIEDNCCLFAGAKIFGGITIGANCQIGANCVIRQNVPANMIAFTNGLAFKKLETDQQQPVDGLSH
jgi:serine O-acetyltransferase